MTAEPGLDRRAFLACFAGSGLATTLFPGVLWARLQQEDRPAITPAVIAEAEKTAGLSFTPEERELMAAGLRSNLEAYRKLRRVELANQVPPALRFDPVPPGKKIRDEARQTRRSRPRVTRPGRLEEVAFWPVTRLAELVRTRQVRPSELTRMYLARLERYDPLLHCVITLTPELAERQARRADAEIAAGRCRGPLHGIPWGAKDLLATRGVRTTWGARPYQNQVIDDDATVVERLERAGAVLVAKLSVGALAWGDVWFGGRTRNPHRPEQGASGSSAGPAAAVAAGLVGFALGTETWGSIVSPADRCGATGLRPTFGRVSRHGSMALSWSMDKVGPLCRSVEDCALVLDTICGPDGRDPTVASVPFCWDAERDVSGLRVGYLPALFDAPRDDAPASENDRRTLGVLRTMGFGLDPLELPDLPLEALALILNAEAAAAFDVLTRTDHDQQLVRQGEHSWPNVLRHSRFIPAVEYLQANRVRTLAIESMARLFEQVDAYLAPSVGNHNLLLTNLTGHPAVVVPNGFRPDNTPTSITFIGDLYREAELLALAKRYQDHTGFQLQPPAMDAAGNQAPR